MGDESGSASAIGAEGTTASGNAPSIEVEAIGVAACLLNNPEVLQAASKNESSSKRKGWFGNKSYPKDSTHSSLKMTLVLHFRQEESPPGIGRRLSR